MLYYSEVLYHDEDAVADDADDADDVQAEGQWEIYTGIIIFSQSTKEMKIFSKMTHVSCFHFLMPPVDTSFIRFFHPLSTFFIIQHFFISENEFSFVVFIFGDALKTRKTP